MESFLFITSANLASNPRLYKEITSALIAGYNVTLIQFKLGNWSDENTEIIKGKLLVDFPQSIDFITLKATAENKLDYLLWGSLEKLCRKTYRLFKKSTLITALASSRRSVQLYRKMRELKHIPNLIIAHNLAALYPAFQFSKKHQIPFTFDVEDYHPGEDISFDRSNERLRRERLMRDLIPEATAVTHASPLIESTTLELTGKISKSTVVLNGFNEYEFESPFENRQNLPRFIWFSQKIGRGRGLEELFEAFKQVADFSEAACEIYLIGELETGFNQEVLQPFVETIANSSIDIKCLEPMAQAVLHRMLREFDIGLALEFNTTDLNRQLCITNKILAYAQSGIYILATDTPAQKSFIKEFNDLGCLTGQNISDLKNTILKIIEEIESIRANRSERFRIGSQFSWDNESVKIIALWKEILDGTK
ncbi:glycosyltransferase [Robertkochia solimangrovi]|uniref:glycosyltransferase n=1 Tax=Robertkochia solimangrovi TaxID=2213046 RepID=UPI00117DBA4D|nr:glycosyltransferase [Robertkochia solimangrovi]TRZ44990.1 hypothetical protein DMZ48_04305 [Robertkochia solimangrovi]